MCKEQFQLTEEERKFYGDAMRTLVDPYVTPISFYDESDESNGEHLGTGYFFEYNENKFLITNYHVAVKCVENPLAYHFKGDGKYVKMFLPIKFYRYPIDVACTSIFDNVWNTYHDESSCIPPEKFQSKFEAVENEIFFIEGYPGQRAGMWGDTMFAQLTPLLTNQVRLVDGYDERMHFALRYDIDNFICTGEQSFLPSPKGMSGSLVWNTKIEECKQKGVKWDISKPTVIGIIHQYCGDDKCVIGTKIEHMRKDELADLALKDKLEIIKMTEERKKES